MLKGLSLFVGSYFIATCCIAGPSSIECQTTGSAFTNNLDDIAKAVACPAPTSSQLIEVCQTIHEQEPSDESSKLKFKYQEALWNISCADPEKDSIATAKVKIQDMWQKYRKEFKCNNADVILPNGNITKFSMDTNFSVFVEDIATKYDLDMNFRDPKDNKTIMDYLSDEVKRFSKMNGDFSNKIKEYNRIYELLKKKGAKHSSELPAEA